jgi:phosphopantothenoylcysteine decarboxylase/phosphopantothenate--cysteine ligase
MGYAIARAASEAGATVTLISGPTALAPPPGVTLVPVDTALQMQAAVEQHTLEADAIVMAAAVADYRAAQPALQKIKKQPGVDQLDLTLVRNPDIIAGLDRPGLLKIGFAAETEDLLAQAQTKLRGKQLAMIVANDAEATIGAEESTATLLFASGETRPLPRMAKSALAEEIVRAIAELLADPGQRAS